MNIRWVIIDQVSWSEAKWRRAQWRTWFERVGLAPDGHLTFVNDLTVICDDEARRVYAVQLDTMVQLEAPAPPFPDGPFTETRYFTPPERGTPAASDWTTGTPWT